MKKTVKIGKKILDVLCWVVVAVLAVSIIISLNARLTGNPPNLFGYSIYRVSSGSMEPELMIGDVILSKEVKDPTTLNVGDVVTYKGEGNMEGELITHKIIVAPMEEDGKLMLQTKGIANDIPDAPIEADRVVSIMIKELTFMNKFYSFFLSPWGLLTIIGLIVFVFIDELIVFIKAATNKRSTKDGEDINEIIERLQREELEKQTKENSKSDTDDKS